MEEGGGAPLQWSDRRLAAVVLGVLFPAMLVTAAFGLPYNIDAMTNVLSAATIGRTGSPILEDYGVLATPEASGVFGWVVESPRGPVSQYPPGAALFAAPFYVLTDEAVVQAITGSNDPDLEPVQIPLPPFWPAALAAALAAAGAAAAVAVSVRRSIGSRFSLATALVLATGTGLWLNGAHELWQHGVAALWIGLGMLAASRQRWGWAGLAHGAAVLTRPTTAVLAGLLAVVVGVRDRRWADVVRYSCGVGFGTAFLLAYNGWLWGELTISGGYSSAFAERLTGAGTGWYLSNLAGALFSVDRGVVVWSPFVPLVVSGLRRVWRDLPTWALGSLLGGVLLFLFQFRLNRYSGGEGFFSYRYALEPIVAASPALAMAASALWRRGPLWRRALVVTMAWSVAVHAVALVIELRI